MDDDEDKGRKKNTDRDFKPEHQHRKDHAPRGALGRPSAGMAGPGLGTPSSRQERYAEAQEQSKSQDVARDDEGKIQFRKSEDRSHDPEKPYAIATGDKEQDKELAKDHNVISREDAEQMIGKEKVAQTFYDEPSKNADQEQDKAMSREEAEKARAKEIMAKFKSDKEKEQGHER